MPSAYLQWWFHTGERVVACRPLVISYSAVTKLTLVFNYPYCLVDLMRFQNLSICIKMVKTH